MLEVQWSACRVLIAWRHASAQIVNEPTLLFKTKELLLVFLSNILT